MRPRPRTCRTFKSSRASPSISSSTTRGTSPKRCRRRPALVRRVRPREGAGAGAAGGAGDREAAGEDARDPRSVRGDRVVVADVVAPDAGTKWAASGRACGASQTWPKREGGDPRPAPLSACSGHLGLIGVDGSVRRDFGRIMVGGRGLASHIFQGFEQNGRRYNQASH